MKYVFITLLTSLLFSAHCFSQACVAGPPITCGSEKVVSPAVPSPSGLGIISSTCNMLTVKWSGAANQQYVVKALYLNTTTNTTDSIAATSISCDASNNCTAAIPVVAGNKYTVSVEAKATIGSCPFYSYAATLPMTYPVQACTQAGKTITFSGKVLLQGAYNTSIKKMNNDLNQLGILQTYATRQPYGNLGYAGTESVGAGFFAAHPTIVDWVLLELHSPNAPATVVAKRAVFVLQDGTLVETDGSGTQISFSGIPPGYYHVVVRHRNHLSIRSALAVDFTSGAGSYDFTTASFQSFINQSYTSTVQMGTVWCMRGGNALGTTLVKYTGSGSAYNQILYSKLGGSLSKVLNNVYAPEDVNMNGNIRWNGPGNDQNFLLNIVLSGSTNTQLQQQQ
jgi:hypothetical protein